MADLLVVFYGFRQNPAQENPGGGLFDPIQAKARSITRGYSYELILLVPHRYLSLAIG